MRKHTRILTGAVLFFLLAALPAIAAEPLKILWYDDFEEGYLPGSIREYLGAKGHTVTYFDDYSGDVDVRDYLDYDVCVAEHTLGPGTLLGLQEWFLAGKGCVALVNGSMYDETKDFYIMTLLGVDENGLPVGEFSGYDWSPTGLYWPDPSHPIANYPNSGWAISGIVADQYRDHVAIIGGTNVLEYAAGMAALVAREGVEGAGRIAYFGSNFHGGSGAADAESRMFVENMIVWAAGSGGAGQAPVADAGGPYLADESQPSILLDGTGSTGTAPLTFAWDLDNDGDYDDSASPTPDFSTFGKSGDFVVGLRVSNAFGSSTDTAIVTVANLPPLADAGDDQAVEQTSPAGADVLLDGSESRDPGNDPLMYTWWEGATILAGPSADPQAQVLLQLGEHVITLFVEDADGEWASDAVTVVVRDTTPPSLTLPADIAVQQENSAGAVVEFDLSASDLCDGDPDVASDPLSGATFPLGATVVTCTATDASGNATIGTFLVTVVDTTPPAASLSTALTTIWPVNHAMVDVGLSWSASDLCDHAPLVELSVTQDEAVSGGDAGTMAPDAIVLRDATGRITGLQLRAERSGRGDGRVYLIIPTVTDASGNVTRRYCAVTVPHSQSKSALQSVVAQAAAAVTAGVPLPYDSTASP